MNRIELPYHLIIPALIAAFALLAIFYKRKGMFFSGKRKWLWIGLTVFFSFYLIIVGAAAYSDISLKLTLLEFDLNGDDFFSGTEITPQLKIAMQKVSSDTARNFSVITGFIISGILAFVVFLIGKTSERLLKKRTIQNLG